MSNWIDTHIQRSSLLFCAAERGAVASAYGVALILLDGISGGLEREFDPQAVRDLKAQLPHDVSVGGPPLAAQAIRTALEC
jgi:hypothetical protein